MNSSRKWTFKRPTEMYDQLGRDQGSWRWLRDTESHRKPEESADSISIPVRLVVKSGLDSTSMLVTTNVTLKRASFEWLITNHHNIHNQDDILTETVTAAGHFYYWKSSNRTQPFSIRERISVLELKFDRLCFKLSALVQPTLRSNWRESSCT